MLSNGKSTVVSEKSSSAHLRGKSLPNSQSNAKLVKQKLEPKQEGNQESSNLEIRLIGCIPNTTEELMFTLLVLMYTPCAIYEFVHTGNNTMLTTALYYAAAWVGFLKITPFVPGGKNKRKDQ